MQWWGVSVAVVAVVAVAAVMVYQHSYSPELDLPWTATDEFVIARLRRRLASVDSQFMSIVIRPSIESSTDKSIIRLCMRDSKKQMYSDNTLIRVLLHEMAHVKTPFVDQQHTSERFINNEKELLTRATELGIYNPSEKFPCDYCSLKACNIQQKSYK